MEDWLSYALLCWFSIFFVVASSPNPSTSIFGCKSNTFFRDYEVITYKTCFISVFLLIYTKKIEGTFVAPSISFLIFCGISIE